MSDYRISAADRETLSHVSTATLTASLIKRGIKRCFMQGVHPIKPGLTMAGHAFTLRYIPSRQDLVDRRYDNSTNVQRLAMEAIGPDQVLVVDARRVIATGTMGDILAHRIRERGCVGVVTDGSLRDTPALRAMDFPIYLGGAAATPSHTHHHPVDMNVPVGCGDVAVMPDDLIVGDGEGVVVIPNAMAREVIDEAANQEELENWVVEQVKTGRPLQGLYPPNEETQAQFKAWKNSQ